MDDVHAFGTTEVIVAAVGLPVLPPCLLGDLIPTGNEVISDPPLSAGYPVYDELYQGAFNFISGANGSGANNTIKAWRRAGIVSAQRYNDKGEYLYNPPDPASPPNRPKIGRRPKNP